MLKSIMLPKQVLFECLLSGAMILFNYLYNSR